MIEMKHHYVNETIVYVEYYHNIYLICVYNNGKFIIFKKNHHPSVGYTSSERVTNEYENLLKLELQLDYLYKGEEL